MPRTTKETRERKAWPRVTKPGSDGALAPVFEVVALRRLADDLYADLILVADEANHLAAENRRLRAAVRQYKDSEVILLATITRMAAKDSLNAKDSL